MSNSNVPALRAPVAMADRGISLRSMDDLGRWCQTVAKSGLAPRGLDTPEKVAVAVQTGMEAGLTPMAALRSVVVINGLPSWKGEAALALIRNAGICSRPPTVGVRGEGDGREGYVTFQRSDMAAPVEVTFSVTDAKRAKLWGKSGPWTDYAEDMLTWRAVGRASKRYFGDVLMGLSIAEEVQDYPADAHGAARVEAAPTEPDPLLDDPRSEAPAEEAVEIDPDTGEVIPDHVGQGTLI